MADQGRRPPLLVFARGYRLLIALHPSMLGRRIETATPQDALAGLAAILDDGRFAVGTPDVKRVRPGPAV